MVLQRSMFYLEDRELIWCNGFAEIYVLFGGGQLT